MLKREHGIHKVQASARSAHQARARGAPAPAAIKVERPMPMMVSTPKLTEVHMKVNISHIISTASKETSI